NTLECLLQVSHQVKLDGLSNHSLPAWSSWEFIRPNIEDGWIVQGPLDGVTRTRHHTQHRRSPCFGNGRLPTDEREASSWVLRHYRSFKYRQQSSICLNIDEKLGSPDPCNDHRSLHLQTPGPTAEEMGSSAKQIDHRSPFVLHCLNSDHCVFVEAEN